MDIVAMRRLPSKDDITLSTQLRAEQLKQLLLILKSWEGPVSAAIYTDRLETRIFVNYLRNNIVLRTRTNVDIHIVKSRGVSNFKLNKKVLLRERKRHTARRVASARYAALCNGGGAPHLR